MAHGAKSRHTVSQQVHRFSRGPGPDFVWQVKPITETFRFLVKLLELRDKHLNLQWQQMDMDERVAVCGDLDEALLHSPPEDMVLSYDFAGEAWSDFVDWMDQEKMFDGRNKCKRRTAAAAVCHNTVGDKRVAMWIFRFGSHERAQEFLEQQRIEALEHSQGSEWKETAQARKKRFTLRSADVTRLKIAMADCPSAWCSCGRWGPQFDCAHCQAQYCKEQCQFVIEKDTDTDKKGRYLVCKRCHHEGKPLELAVEAKLPPHAKTRRCEAYISFARKCINSPICRCRFCNRWLCQHCSGERPVCVACPAKIKHHAIQLKAPGSGVWASLPTTMQRYLRMTEEEFAEEVRQADRMTARSDTGGRFLGDGQGFQEAGRAGRGVVYTADPSLVRRDA